ncbi:hypothetical protein V8C40DRAFT_276873 [Trichoderma camerunense]
MPAESKRRDIFKPAFATVQDTSAQYGRDIEDLENLPDEFIQVNQCFLVAKETLSYARKNATWDASSTDSVQSSATSLEKKAKMLQKIFSQVGEEMENDSNDESVLDCYRDTLLKLGKSYRVEVLMLGLLKDLIVLFTKELLKAEDYMKFDELKEAIDTMSQVESSVSDDDFKTSGANFTQNVASGGTGNQSYYGGRGHHVFNGSGAVTNYHATHMSFAPPYSEGQGGHDSRHANANNTVDRDQLQRRSASQAQAGGRPRGREDFQIAIICALPLEYDAVLLLLDKFWDDDESYRRARGDMNSYTNGRMGQYDVVLALLPNMGTVAAAGAAASFRSSYPNLQLAFLVGICGGVPKGDGNEIHLGDVIISKSAVQYDLGKQYHEAFVIRDTVDDTLGRPNKNIRSLVASFQTEHIRDQLQQKACLYLKDLQSAAAKKRRPQNYQYPGINNDKLFKTSHIHKHRGKQQLPCKVCDDQTDAFCEQAAKESCDKVGCDETELEKRTDLEMRGSTGYPEIFVGRIASGNSVMKSGEHRDRIAEEQKVIALEMEGAGVWDEIPCIIVKGVCDYADSHKNDLWQRYAAATAASPWLLTKAKMERSNGNDFAQHIASNGTGYQNYYSGRGHQIMAGSGTIHNYNAAHPNFTHADNSREKIMQALYTSPYLQRKNRNPDRVIGTCEWFMDHHDFHNWRNNTASSMLWVSANPGCGKSVLAKYLVDELKTTEQRTTCYFFFKDDFEDQRSAKGALSCLLHQLFFQRERLFSAEIVKRFKSYKAPPANSYYELWELWDILTMATQEKNAGEIICILDAFDECVDQERQDLAKILREFYGPNSDTKKSVNLKFLITSRPYDTIRRNLIRPFDSSACPIIHLKGDGDAEVEKISGEINLYVKDRVSLLRADLGLTRKEEEILLQGLGAIHNQTYLWVYLTLEWIETEISNKISEAEIRNAISTLPRTVDEAYDKILAKSTDMKKTKTLLHIVVAAERPLTLAEMDLALAIRRRHKTYEELALRPSDRVRKYIRDLCGLFISITDDKIYLLHQTAKEFLVPKDGLDNPEYKKLQRLCSATPDRCPAWFEIYWADIHTDLPLGFTTLMIASYFGLEMIVSLQIESEHVEIDSVDGSYHRTALSFASENGFDNVVRLLIKGPKFRWKRALKKARSLSYIKGADINAIDKYDRTALIYATWNGHVSIVKRLLKARARVDIADTIGGTPISYALCYGQQDVATELMRGAQPDSVDEIRRKLLLSAVKYSHEPVVKRLLDSGADPGATDDEGISPLILATKQRKKNIVELLIEKGADVNKGDRNGRGADVNQGDYDSTTPLILSMQKFRGAIGYDLVEMLLKGGATVNYTVVVSNIHTYTLYAFDS